MKRACLSAVMFSLLCTSVPALAVPPHPSLRKEVQEGKRPEPGYMRQVREKGAPKVKGKRKALGLMKKKGLFSKAAPGVSPAPGFDAPDTAPADTAAAPAAVGTPNVLALLVSFSDVTGQAAPAFFESLIFGGAFPSVRHYYGEVSGGALSLTTVDPPSSEGWLPLTGTKAGYNADIYLQAMVQDSVAAADPTVNFSDYDNDGDGAVDYFIVIHPGTGGELTGSNDDIWSRTATLPTPIATADGVVVDTFMTVPEYWLNPGDMTIGVYAHEFAHLLGLIDLYDLGSDSAGIGDWGLMGHGAWNGPISRAGSPAYPGAWSRAALGWVDPAVPSGNLDGVVLQPVEEGGPVYYLWNDGAPNNEYFLVENRQQIGYDLYLPSHGLLVWHIDENMTTNNHQALSHNDCYWNPHYLVALQQADGDLGLEKNLSTGDAGDPYPGVLAKTGFSSDSAPNSGSYRDCLSQVAVRGINEGGTAVSADLQVSAPPELMVEAYRSGAPLFPGREATLTVALLNGGGNVAGVTAELVSSSSLVTVTQPYATYPPIAFGETGMNDTAPFRVMVDPSALPGDLADLQILYTTDGMAGTEALDVALAVEPEGVLFMDDDRNSPGDFSSFFLTPLATLGRAATHWDGLVRGTPPPYVLEHFPLLLWTTAATFSDTVTAEQEDFLTSYLMGGGSLVLSSQDYYDDRGYTPFALNYLRLSGFTGEAAYSLVTGYNSDPVSGNLGPYTLAYPFPNRSDYVFSSSQSSPFLRKVSGSPAAVRYEGPLFSTAFFGFPMEALGDGDRTETIAHLLPWLDKVPGEGTGDGLADLLLVSPGGAGGKDLQVLESEGYAVAGPVLRGDLGGDEDYFIRGDVNGDGLGDLVWGRILDADTVEWDVHLAVWSDDGGGPVVAFEDWNLSIPWSRGAGSPESSFFLGDADGDGKEDLIFAEEDPANRRNLTWWVARSTGRSFLNPVVWSAAFGSPTKGTYLVGDVSGDGRADLLYLRARRCEVARSTGTAFVEIGVWSKATGGSRADYYLGDVNGDGVEDLVYSRDGKNRDLEWSASLSTGRSFAASETWSEGFGGDSWTGFGLVDLDGDGASDLVGWGLEGVDWIFRASYSTGMRFGDPGTVGRFPALPGDAVIP
jgi:M6 family metalloprotease-like protein